MNIDDVKTDKLDVPADDLVMAHIFDHQKDLAKRYIDIERRNGFWKPDMDVPLDQHIDNAQFQNWIKNMFWRATEEIAEAWEAYNATHQSALNWKDQWEDDQVRHFVEEMIDSLHFITEVCVFINYPPEVATDMIREGMRIDGKIQVYFVESLFEYISKMGLAANCLKNKPWKTSHMGTDQLKFVTLIGEVWKCWGIICGICEFSFGDLYKLYVQKHTVNVFRQNTAY